MHQGGEGEGVHQGHGQYQEELFACNSVQERKSVVHTKAVGKATTVRLGSKRRTDLMCKQTREQRLVLAAEAALYLHIGHSSTCAAMNTYRQLPGAEGFVQ